jgi:hypothetical protein
MHAVYRRKLLKSFFDRLAIRPSLRRNMAATIDDSSNGTLEENFEQVVTMETVIAADNKGIDYNKLISKRELPLKKLLREN